MDYFQFTDCFEHEQGISNRSHLFIAISDPDDGALSENSEINQVIQFNSIQLDSIQFNSVLYVYHLLQLSLGALRKQKPTSWTPR